MYGRLRKQDSERSSDALNVIEQRCDKSAASQCGTQRFSICLFVCLWPHSLIGFSLQGSLDGNEIVAPVFCFGHLKVSFLYHALYIHREKYAKQSLLTY